MSFDVLRLVTTVVNKETLFFERIDDWESKRHALLVQVHDYPSLIEAYKTRTVEPHPEDSRLSFTDEVPRIRLANACEATTNTLYGMAELAAQFGNLASKGLLPSSFNDLRKKVRAGKLDPALATTLDDLQWYEKVRELRTEWAHYSSSFVAEEHDEPVLIVRAYRRSSDRVQFARQITCTLPELITWTNNAISTVDNYAGYLVTRYLIPRMPMEQVIPVAKRDQFGMPILKGTMQVEVEEMTIREYFASRGLKIEK